MRKALAARFWKTSKKKFGVLCLGLCSRILLLMDMRMLEPRGVSTAPRHAHRKSCKRQAGKAPKSKGFLCRCTAKRQSLSTCCKSSLERKTTNRVAHLRAFTLRRWGYALLPVLLFVLKRGSCLRNVTWKLQTRKISSLLRRRVRWYRTSTTSERSNESSTERLSKWAFKATCCS